VFDDPALTVGLALGAGMLLQVLARHLRLPGIVLLLGAGVLLGPEVAGVIRPDALGESMQILVGFAVAIILFEGGMNLDVRRLRREGRAIQQLVTVGAAITAVGGTLAARWILGWEWAPAVLFGTLVIVTGPTVVTPLLRRIRVKRRIATVLEAEGVFGDAIGAILAVVALEVVTSPNGGIFGGAWHAALTLGTGCLFGVVFGFAIAALLRVDWLIPEGLENVTTLALCLVCFQISNAVLHESGIAAAVVAGLVVGNLRAPVVSALHAFKEQLTVMFIGLLFILLAADVRLADVYALGWPGVATVLALMFIVRPLNIFIGTWGTELSTREKAFMSWLAPRGIVAAAVSAMFAQKLAAAGIPGGEALQGLVFLVIATTVLVQGLSGGQVARALDLACPIDNGYVILGANALARAVAGPLAETGEEVVLIDAKATEATRAEQAGFRVIFGSGLSERVLLQSSLRSRRGVVALICNQSTNLLFVRRARRGFHVHHAWSAIDDDHHIKPSQVEAAGARLLFGAVRDIELWAVLLEHGDATVSTWTAGGPLPDTDALLPLVYEHEGVRIPYDTLAQPGDTVWLATTNDRRDEASSALEAAGWSRGPTAE